MPSRGRILVDCVVQGVIVIRQERNRSSKTDIDHEQMPCRLATVLSDSRCEGSMNIGRARVSVSRRG